MRGASAGRECGETRPGEVAANRALKTLAKAQKQ